MNLASLSSLPALRRARPRTRGMALVASTGLLALLLLGLLLARPAGASPTVPGTAAAGAPMAGANQIQAAPPAQAVTNTVGAGAAAPAAVGTSAPGAVQTGGPQTVLTGGPQPIPSGNPAGVGATGAT